MRTTYTIREGEPLMLVLTVEEGEIETVNSVVANMKRTNTAGSIPPSTVAVLATLDVEEDLELPGWRLSLTEAETDEFGIGTYIIDAALDVVGYGIIYTDPVIVSIKGRITDVNS